MDEKTQALISKYIKLSPVEFEQSYETEPPSQEDIERLESIATHLLFVAEYMYCRKYGSGHKSAVKFTNKANRKIRKAQGYNITHDIIF